MCESLRFSDDFFSDFFFEKVVLHNTPLLVRFLMATTYKGKKDDSAVSRRWKPTHRKGVPPKDFDRKKSPTGSSSPNESSRSPADHNHHPSSESSETKTETKISNGSLLIPSMPDRLSHESQHVLDALARECQPLTGTQAWVPIIDISSSPSAPSAGSFYGGHKILMKQETEWPVCLTCKAPLIVVAQIDRTTLPHALGGKGLVQVFACAMCAKNKTDIRPKSTCWANVTFPGGTKDSNLIVKECPASCEAVPLRRIVKWLPRQDYMHPEDVERNFEKQLTMHQWAVIGEAQIRSDKIGGYPCWLDKDSRNRIACKICKTNMRLLAQIDSCDNVPIEWGTDGCLLVFECQQHTDIVTAVMMSNSNM